MKAVLMFSGFTESEDRRTGFEKGFFDVVRRYSSPSVTTYHPRTWKADVGDILRQLYDNGVKRVAVLCYSHGQSAAVDFAKRAERYGIVVDHLLACDPVYRPSWLPRATWAQVFAFRAVVGNPTIKIPPTVREVQYVYQRVSKPSGHMLVPADSKRTKMHAPVKVSLAHTRIDESPEYWGMVSETLDEWTSVGRIVHA